MAAIDRPQASFLPAAAAMAPPPAAAAVAGSAEAPGKGWCSAPLSECCTGEFASGAREVVEELYFTAQMHLTRQMVQIIDQYPSQHAPGYLNPLRQCTPTDGLTRAGIYYWRGQKPPLSVTTYRTGAKFKETAAVLRRLEEHATSTTFAGEVYDHLGAKYGFLDARIQENMAKRASAFPILTHMRFEDGRSMPDVLTALVMNYLPVICREDITDFFAHAMPLASHSITPIGIMRQNVKGVMLQDHFMSQPGSRNRPEHQNIRDPDTGKTERVPTYQSFPVNLIRCPIMPDHRTEAQRKSELERVQSGYCDMLQHCRAFQVLNQAPDAAPARNEDYEAFLQPMRMIFNDQGIKDALLAKIKLENPELTLAEVALRAERILPLILERTAHVLLTRFLFRLPETWRIDNSPQRISSFQFNKHFKEIVRQLQEPEVVNEIRTAIGMLIARQPLQQWGCQDITSDGSFHVEYHNMPPSNYLKSVSSVLDQLAQRLPAHFDTNY